MKNSLAFLFDLDGVIIDTEPQYDVFWKSLSEKYQLGIDQFECLIKGVTLPNIISRHFSHFSKEEQVNVEKEVQEFEKNMKIDYIPGAYEFLKKAKDAGIKMALVTSSNNEKLSSIFQKVPILPFFDAVVSADRITEGKPHPMPFLLAAKDLDLSPDDCIVFEDSFNGIKSGNAAGMKVIGLSTTNPKESIEKDVFLVFPDFKELVSGEMFGRFVKNVSK